jgi:hypothetical protein
MSGTTGRLTGGGDRVNLKFARVNGGGDRTSRVVSHTTPAVQLRSKDGKMS